MKVKEILKNKGPEVFTISENKPLRDAIKILVNNNIGSLIVLNDSASISGIVTERDVLHESFRNPDSFMEATIAEVMTRNLIIVEPDDEIEYVESIMTQNRIRHLPVVHNKILVGLISIGDVVKTQLNEFRHELKYLKDYIEGNFS